MLVQVKMTLWQGKNIQLEAWSFMSGIFSGGNDCLSDATCS